MKHLISAILVLSFSLFGYGQSASTILGNDAVGIIDSLSDKLLSGYLYPEKAKKIVTLLQDHKFQLSSTQQLETKKFVNQVNTIMFDVTSDHHLKFYYDPEKFETFLSANESIIDSIEREQYRRINFGVQKLENLTNNIGLLRLNKFQQYEDVREVILGAMMVLANSDAVIIDLRINGGGDGRTKEYLESFFLSEKAFFSREVEFIDTVQFREINRSCSTCARLEDVPLCILTGNGTFSAAEGFCYDLQQAGRARIIGTKTKGGGHSGSSVALSKGFLVFIPVSGKNSPIEGVGIMPDLETREDVADLSAKKLIIDEFIAACAEPALLAQYRWNAQTMDAYLAESAPHQQTPKSVEGEYSRGFSVTIIDGEPYLLNRKNEMKSRLVAIEANYFIARDNTDFGDGNYRIQFLDDGNAKLQVNLGVKIAEMPLEKKN
jgi:hypothetical protein